MRKTEASHSVYLRNSAILSAKRPSLKNAIKQRQENGVALLIKLQKQTHKGNTDSMKKGDCACVNQKQVDLCSEMWVGGSVVQWWLN